MPSVTLDTSLVDALGAKTAGIFQRAFAIETVGDLLTHYPRRYARRGELTPIASLPLGEQVTIVAAFGASTTAASVSSIPGVHSGAAKESGVFSGSAAPYLDTYALAFRESISDSSDSYHYFSGNDLTIFSSGSVCPVSSRNGSGAM